ncbi:MAG: DoxX family protein [Micromonosporaceae bacterium]
MDVIALVGRILLAAVLVVSGVGHFLSTDAMAEVAASRKLPSPRLAVLAGGVWNIVAGTMIVLGIWIDLAALMAVLFLLGAAVLIHNFWAETEVAAQQAAMTQFLKDLALAGAGLLLFVLYGEFGDQMGLTITGPLF